MIDYNDYAETLAKDLMADMPDDVCPEEYIYETSNEYADGSEHVIYYSKAHAFVQWMCAADQAYWEEEIGAGGSFVSYDDLACRIAYYELSAMITSYALAILEKQEEDAA